MDESMAMASMPSIWASMYSWFTPSVLFVFLNLMIGTIAITSSLASNKSGRQHNPQNGELDRSPSVLQRLKSINLYTYKSHEPISTTFPTSPEISTHFAVQQTPEPTPPNPQSYLSRSPSVLQRLKSFNLYNYISQEPTADIATWHKSQEMDTQYTTQVAEKEPEEEESGKGEEAIKAEEEEEEEEDAKGEDQQSLDEIYSKLKGIHVTRSNSDTQPSSGLMPQKLPKKMKKSASTKSAFAHFKENDVIEARRPATTRETKPKKIAEDVEDEEVDAKADDFINRFKQQLKLQRVDSIMRYKEIISRGNEK